MKNKYFISPGNQYQQGYKFILDTVRDHLKFHAMPKRTSVVGGGGARLTDAKIIISLVFHVFWHRIHFEMVPTPKTPNIHQPNIFAISASYGREIFLNYRCNYFSFTVIFTSKCEVKRHEMLQMMFTACLALALPKPGNQIDLRV
jgi:hypothetical protein